MTAEITIVTGGSSGIGQAAVKHLSELGRRVVSWDVSDRSSPVDVTDWGSVLGAVERATQLGNIVALVNCAGIRTPKGILDISLDEWNRDIAVDLTGPFHCTKAVAAHMVAAGVAGSIVNISSTAGLHGSANRAAYCSSKAGLLGLTRAAAKDLGRYGIRVNAITPGPIRTPLTDVLRSDDADSNVKLADVPIGRRWGEPAEVAAVIEFLLSPSASFISSSVISVDGGLYGQ